MRKSVAMQTKRESRAAPIERLSEPRHGVEQTTRESLARAGRVIHHAMHLSANSNVAGVAASHCFGYQLASNFPSPK